MQHGKKSLGENYVTRKPAKISRSSDKIAKRATLKAPETPNLILRAQRHSYQMAQLYACLPGCRDYIHLYFTISVATEVNKNIINTLN